MKLIIDIPEEKYEMFQTGGYAGLLDSDLYADIKNGIPLPKGHGRIGDLDAVYKDICNGIEAMTDVGMYADGQYLWGKLNDALDNAPTIIEADAESEG